MDCKFIFLGFKGRTCDLCTADLNGQPMRIARNVETILPLEMVQPLVEDFGPLGAIEVIDVLNAEGEERPKADLSKYLRELKKVAKAGAPAPEEI